MTYQELERLNKAFSDFMLKIYKKSSIEIKYYQLHKRSIRYDVAYIGYETISGGLHGIHYTEQIKSYKFGTFEEKGESWIMELNFREVCKIPSYIKDTFYEVVRNKKNKIIKVKKRGNGKLNEWQ